MIREFDSGDIEQIMRIWLDTNIKAHGFIESKYFLKNEKDVKKALPLSEVYIHQDEKRDTIQGFIGMNGSFIAGIFVDYKFQSNGIGKELLDFAKNIKESLTLNVYQKNIKAIKFYKREGFEILSEGIDLEAKEKEFSMRWDSKRI